MGHDPHFIFPAVSWHGQHAAIVFRVVFNPSCGPGLPMAGIKTDFDIPHAPALIRSDGPKTIITGKGHQQLLRSVRRRVPERIKDRQQSAFPLVMQIFTAERLAWKLHTA